MSNSTFYDQLAPRYHGLRYGRAYHRASAGLELDWLNGFLPRGRYLEVGPGTGRVTEHLLNFATQLVAVDVSAGMLEQLRERLGAPAQLETRLLDVSALDQLEGYGAFDCAVSLRVLPHLEDLPGALARLADAVRPGGVVVFDLWNSWGYDGLAKRVGLRRTAVYTRYRSIGQMQRAVDAAGLRVLGRRGFGY